MIPITLEVLPARRLLITPRNFASRVVLDLVYIRNNKYSGL